MNKPLKYSLAGFGALVALLVIAAAAFLASFDANRYKAEIEAQAGAATGRVLRIGGDLDVKFFPWLAVSARDLDLSNRAGFGDSPMLHIDEATARVRLMPLLSRRIEVGEVRIEGLALTLARRADGTDNWSDIGEDSKQAPEPAAGGEPLALSVAGVAIVDAKLTLDDAQAKSRLAVEDFDLDTGAVALGQPIDFTGGMRVKQDALAAKLGFRGRAAAGFDSFTDLALTFDAEGEPLPAPVKDGKVAIAKLALGEPLEAEGLVLELWGLKLAGELTLQGDEMKAKLASEQFEPRALMKTLGMDVPVTADPKALGSAQLAFALTQRGDLARIEDLALSIDKSKLTGRVMVDSIERSAVRFELALDAMDLDRYLPPEAKDEQASGGLDAVELSTEALRELDLAGRFSAGKLSVAKADVSDLKLGVVARGGALELQSLSAKLYGGRVDAKGTLDGRGKVPAAAFKLDLKSFDIGAFMQDVVGKTYATGTAALAFDLKGSGATAGDVKRDLDGDVRFDVQQGTLEGFNVWKQARIAYAAYKKRETTAKSDPDRTEFEKLAGGADLKDGVATLVGVTAAIPFAAVTAKGTVDLKKDALKVEAQAKITGAPVFGANEDYSDIQGATLPVKISGPFADPSVSVDVLKAAVSTLKPDKLLKDDKLKKKLKGIFG